MTPIILSILLCAVTLSINQMDLLKKIFLFSAMAILVSCEKSEDPDMKKVYYASQSGYGGGNNPSNGSYSTGLPTGTTTPVTCTRTMVVNGVSGTNVSSPSGTTTNYIITVVSNLGTVTITFGNVTAPANGTYNVVTASPSSAQCTVSYGGTNASAGSVHVSTGTTNQASLSGIICGTSTVSATACY